MLTLYPKNVADNIPAHVLKQIARKSKMPKHEHRSIGVEILEGIRQLKLGEIGRVQHFPIGDGGPRTGRSVAVGGSHVCLACRFEHSKNGNKAVAFHLVRPKLC